MSKLITCEISDTSMPRAATSVATKMSYRPLRNPSMARLRCDWTMLPWSPATRYPWFFNSAANSRVRRLVRVKMSTLPVSVFWRSLSNSWYATRGGRIEGVGNGLGGCTRLDLYEHRVTEHSIRQSSYFGLHGSAEKQGLAGTGKVFENSPDVRKESHVAHPVRLVQNQHLDSREIDASPGYIVE